MVQPRRINLDEQAKIGSLTTIIIQDGAITTPKVAPGAIDASLLQDGSVVPAKLNSLTFGLGVIPNVNGTLSRNDNTVVGVELIFSKDTLSVGEELL